MATIQQCYRGGYEGRPGWWIQFDFDASVIAALKARIPATQRSYNEDTHVWWFADAVEPAVLALLPPFAAYLAQPSLF